MTGSITNAELSTQMGLLQQSLNGLVTAFGEFKVQTRTELQEIRTFYATLSEKFQERQKTNWPVMLSILGVAAMGITAFLSIITLKTENAIGPVQKDIAETKSVVYANRDDLRGQQTEISNLQKSLQENNARDERSVVDRMEHARLIEINSRNISEFQKVQAAQNAERVANEREIETQFDADGQLRNVQWATMMRRHNDLQNAVSQLGGKTTTTSDGPYYFPNISHRRDSEQTP